MVLSIILNVVGILKLKNILFDKKLW